MTLINSNQAITYKPSITMNTYLINTSGWLMANTLTKNIDKTNFILIYFLSIYFILFVI